MIQNVHLQFEVSEIVLKLCNYTVRAIRQDYILRI